MAEGNASGSASIVLTNLDRLLPELERLYEDIHAHPELSMQEIRTAGIAADRLRKAGFEVTAGVGKTGVVGLLRNGEGPTLMLRADMDALPIAEETGLDYASKATATDADGKTVVRERLVELFEVVGTDDARVVAARRRLTNLLY